MEIYPVGVHHRDRIGSGFGALDYLTGYGHGPGSAAFEKLPLWLITAIVFRAGVVEELFYRGYAIERLQDRSGPVLVGGDSAGDLFAWPLVGWRGQHSHRVRSRLNPDRFYLWRRDLAANMIGHGLVDFVANVLPKLFS